jgi:hypothetical protein
MFDVVGVQFDTTRHEDVAFEVDTSLGWACADVGDASVADEERSVKNLSLKHDARVGEDEIGGHRRPSRGWME